MFNGTAASSATCRTSPVAAFSTNATMPNGSAGGGALASASSETDIAADLRVARNEWHRADPLPHDSFVMQASRRCFRLHATCEFKRVFINGEVGVQWTAGVRRLAGELRIDVEHALRSHFSCSATFACAGSATTLPMRL